ncbi:Non-canonical non-ribosomal peptide synthetase-like protein 1 [Elsinoe fawcettii]|nr:Non-canonical non-ribosomal peptide synthetase-like protein 1 [Elsinoe fawcettii]
MASPNYFTCTLGQATSLGLTNSDFKNITAFIDAQAGSRPDRPAVGFATPPASSSETWDHELFTYRTLSQRSIALAVRLKSSHGKHLGQSKTVALLAPSTPSFLFTWLALMRLGYAVLLIAPQCQPAAIAHLCDSCEVSALFHDEQYAEQAQQASSEAKDKDKDLAAIILQQYQGLSMFEVSVKVGENQFPSPQPTDVAYLHHTSGTSSGLPKPIPQSHRAGCGVLPSFPDGHEAATFTTTPLYHGGIADCFRAWTSGALIWLFPGKGVPITANNIVQCLDIAANLSEAGETPPVRYFSSVPYVLQSMEASEPGLAHLRRMSIVGVGGAALPAEIGERLITSSVPLISRFGSAECGFLMSSHRDYSSDSAWQYLRAPPSSGLIFEPQASSPDRYELIIPPTWPHMAKRNRPNGSFATADLFTPHDTIEGAWKYHSRSDSQLTLITGKKFDPAPLEDGIATSALLSDVLIFGNGRPYPGALLFRSTEARDMSDDELVGSIWPHVQKLNAESQDHARLRREMLLPMEVLDRALEKSSKGTVIRGAAEKRFADVIEGAYSEAVDAGLTDVADGDVEGVLLERVQRATNAKTKPGRGDDLFAFGVDSVAGMMVRNDVRQLVGREVKVPLNIVEDCGTVERLVEYVLRTRRGEGARDVDAEERELMLEMAERYGRFDDVKTVGDLVNGKGDKHVRDGQVDKDVVRHEGEVIVLTGVTGALGAHLLDTYSHEESTKKVYCLVRGATDHACRERVVKALQARGLRDLVDDKVAILRAQLGEDKLGLGDEDYARLTQETTTILHVAWAVNFRMRLRAFEKDHIGGLRNLVRLALSSTRSTSPQIGFCSSVASVLAHSRPIPEVIVDDPSAATSLGYSRSKWVAEQVCAAASRHPRLSGRVKVFRVGQLGGDSERGIWNASEAWPLMVSVGIKVLHAMPMLKGEKLDWLPVDVASRALREGMMEDPRPAGGDVGGVNGGSDESVIEASRDDGRHLDRVIEGPDGRSRNRSGQYGPTTASVMHVVHDGLNPVWRQLLEWLQEEQAGTPFAVVDPAEWVELLERASERKGVATANGDSSLRTKVGEVDEEEVQGHQQHPAFKLLDLWKSAYGKASGGTDMTRDDDTSGQDEGSGCKTFAMEKTKAAIPVLKELKPVDKQYVVRIWRWIDENM